MAEYKTPKLGRLTQIREDDERGPRREVLPEKQSLNLRKIRTYLRENDFTVDNFEERWNFDLAVKILNIRKTPGESKLEAELRKAKDWFESNGIDFKNRFEEENNPNTFKSYLEKELRTRDALDKMPELMEAYLKYQTIRRMALRSLKVKEKFHEMYEEQKVEAGESVTDSLKETWEEMKDNWNEMSSREKMVAGAAILIGAVWLFSKSDSETGQKFKKALMGALKVAGVAVGVNYVYKIFRGKTLLDETIDVTKSNLGKVSYWRETFKTNDTGAETLHKSFVFMRNEDFRTVAKNYREAKALGVEKMKLPGISESDMKPEEIYRAADVFFSRYPASEVERKYKNHTPPATWEEVAGAEIILDDRLKFSEWLPERFYEGALEYAAEFNSLQSGEKSLADVEERRSLELFTKDSKIEYAKLPSYEQERLRIRFLLDSTQTVELEKICDWFTKKYRGIAGTITIPQVMEQLFTNDEDREAALENTGVRQGLASAVTKVEALESRCNEIENDAVTGIGEDDMVENAKLQLRHEFGYRVRLAIMGDPQARLDVEKVLKVMPATPENEKEVLKRYEDYCEEYVEANKATF